MAGHKVLHADLLKAVSGELPTAPRPVGFAGSYNYGRMRNATAYIAGDALSRKQARDLWLGNEAEQLAKGHWSHAAQCEQGCPQPHLEFNLEPALAVWLEAIKHGDTDMAHAAMCDVGRTLALARLFNLGGVVCMPGARAKDSSDSSNDQGVNQWRQRPLDVMLALVLKYKPIKYEGPAITMFKQLREYWEELALLSTVPPKLAFPIHCVRFSGRGYAAWIEPTPEAKARLLDPLNEVVFEFGRSNPTLVYDWGKAPNWLPASDGRLVYGL